MNEILAKIQENVAEIRTSQAVMQRDLAHHIRRTDIAEEAIQFVRDDMKPIKRHVAMLEGSLKFVGILTMVATLLTAVLKLLGVI